MSRKVVMSLLAIIALAAPASAQPPERATTVKSSKSNTSDRLGTVKDLHPVKRNRAKQVGPRGPSGIAVSDPGAEGSKPTKKSNK